jgi:hypothetical protein
MPVDTTRRCWRCLQEFPLPDDVAAVSADDWWLCDACHAALIGKP